ncbi:hypothetical protein K492DRAFT_211064 [Lichtheimia hyalospora FSU 10163]|nr:hypothetical protein K492DRAFT_211064 [Lichtheimia hyalospora FSU 10163]
MLLTNHFPSSTTQSPHTRIPSTDIHHNSSSSSPPLIARASPLLPSSRRPSLDPASRSLHPLPSFRHHPYSQPDHRTLPAAAASDSRRSSLASIVSTATTTTANTSSSPSSPPHRRRSPSIQYQYQYRSPESDPLSRFPANTLPPPSQQSPPSPLHNTAINNNGGSLEPWRRDSLPSISQITRFRENSNDTEMSMSSTTGNNESSSSSNAMWLDEPVSSQHQHPAITSPVDNMRRHSVAITSSARYNQRQNGNGGGVVTPSLRRSSLARMRQPDDDTEQLATRERAGSSSSAYSRSPELRISHKLAERKRRKEMNDLFDELRDILPVEKGLKTSKWEILSKALEYIATLRERETQWTQEKDQLHRELASLQHPSSTSSS